MSVANAAATLIERITPEDLAAVSPPTLDAINRLGEVLDRSRRARNQPGQIAYEMLGAESRGELDATDYRVAALEAQSHGHHQQAALFASLAASAATDRAIFALAEQLGLLTIEDCPSIAALRVVTFTTGDLG